MQHILNTILKTARLINLLIINCKQPSSEWVLSDFASKETTMGTPRYHNQNCYSETATLLQPLSY